VAVSSSIILVNRVKVMNVRSSFLIVALSCLLANSAFADPTPADLKKAEEVFTESERLYKTGDYQKALEGYKQAYFLTELPDFLYNMAQCQRQLKNYTSALDLYKNYLREVPNSPIKDQVQKTITEIEPLAKEQKALQQTDFSYKFKEALPRLKVPSAMIGGWVGFGIIALVIHGRIETTGVASPGFYNAGRAFALASDAALIAAGVTAYLALKPQKEKAASLMISPVQQGATVLFTFAPKASK
jgi:tetratricopeptide (TPR) repeat protein